MNTVFRGLAPGLSLKNAVLVNPNDDLAAKYDWLKSADRDGVMGALLVTNPRFLVRTPGIYTDNLSVDTKYVYLVDLISDSILDTGTLTYTNQYGTTFGDGSGDSKANAINIDSVEAYKTFVSATGDYGKYILLTAHLDFKGETIPRVSNTFTGTFDGNGFSMSNFTANTPDTVNKTALFPKISNTATIKNLTVKNAIIIGSNYSAAAYAQYTAVIAAEAAYGSYIQNCCVINAKIETVQDNGQPSYCGVIAGANHSRVEDCIVIGGIIKGDVTNSSGTLYIGGIVGYQIGLGAADLGWIKRSTSTISISDISGSSIDYVQIGGCVGYVGGYVDTIEDCSYEGRVNYNSAHGIKYGGCAASVQSGNIVRTTSTATVSLSTTDETNSSEVGGLIGSIALGSISNCWSKSDITFVGKAALICGGCTGNSAVTITDTYCEGSLDITLTVYDSYVRIGGFSGMSSPNTVVNRCWSDMDISVDGGVAAVWVGGFYGNPGNSAPQAIFTDCYCKGSFYDAKEESSTVDWAYAGGFFGFAGGITATNCIAIMDTYAGGAGFTDYSYGTTPSPTYTDCLWDTDTAGFTTADSNATGQTTTQLMTNSTYSAMGFDFDLSSGRDWKQIDGFDYPKLDWE